MNKTLRCGCTPHEGADLHNIPGCPVLQAQAYRHENERLNKRLDELSEQYKATLSIVEKVVGALSLTLPDNGEKEE